VDGTEPNTANIVLGYTQAITFNYNQNLILRRLERLGLRGVEPPLQSDVRFWFNEELESHSLYRTRSDRRDHDLGRHPAHRADGGPRGGTRQFGRV